MISLEVGIDFNRHNKTIPLLHGRYRQSLPSCTNLILNDTCEVWSSEVVVRTTQFCHVEIMEKFLGVSERKLLSSAVMNFFNEMVLNLSVNWVTVCPGMEPFNAAKMGGPYLARIHIQSGRKQSTFLGSSFPTKSCLHHRRGKALFWLYLSRRSTQSRNLIAKKKRYVLLFAIGMGGMTTVFLNFQGWKG